MTQNKTITILCLGDSLTEGYGVSKDEAYPALIEKKFAALANTGGHAHKINIINAGISGSTTASAESRLKWYFKQKPNIMFLALGANDGLRGQNIEEAKAHLRSAIRLARANGIEVWLAGMQMPPNYGEDYTKKFKQMFTDLAHAEKTPFYAFLLAGVALHPDLIQPDGLHPNAKGHIELGARIFKFFDSELTKYNATESRR